MASAEFVNLFSESESDDSSQQTPQKKKKRLQKFREEYAVQYEWASKVSNNVFQAYCQVCSKKFGIAHGGVNDLSRHQQTAAHQANKQAQRSSRSITDFFLQQSQQDVSLQENVSAAEATCAFHSAKHNLSYNSQDCSTKLYRYQFSDSRIAKSVACGRTKLQAIITGVLAPESVRSILMELSENHFFSLATDASNHGNTKMFPLVLQYFSPTKGLQLKLYDLYPDHKEDAITISNKIKTALERGGLDINSITGYAADNANVNYGKHHSVFTELKKMNKDLLAVNCPAHIVHNCARHAFDSLTFDIESCVLRLFSHFSNSAQREHQLMEFYDFVDIEYKKLLGHVVTRLV